MHRGSEETRLGPAAVAARGRTGEQPGVEGATGARASIPPPRFQWKKLAIRSVTATGAAVYASSLASLGSLHGNFSRPRVACTASGRGARWRRVRRRRLARWSHRRRPQSDVDRCGCHRCGDGDRRRRRGLVALRFVRGRPGTARRNGLLGDVAMEAAPDSEPPAACLPRVTCRGSRSRGRSSSRVATFRWLRRSCCSGSARALLASFGGASPSGRQRLRALGSSELI
jgi:hypothetical protein